MKNLIDFFSFTDSSTRYVVLGVLLLMSSSSVVGTFTFLKKKALVGDAVAHSVLPGVCLAFMLAGNKNPVWLITGAFITGWISLYLIDTISAKSKIKEDTAIGLILSVFFGVGILLLTIIQHSGNAEQSGLNSFLFGQAAALVGKDLYVFGGVALVLLTTITLFFKELSLLTFDEAFARSIGLPVRALELLLTTLTVLAVVVGIQAVGVVLMAAILITPAAAARFWTDDIKTMIALAAFFGAVSGLVGTYISYVYENMPTGPWIVMIISGIAFTSFFFAPKKGILHKLFRQIRIKNKMNQENILKLLYQLGEEGKDFFVSRSISDITTRRPFPMRRLIKGLRTLKRQGFLKEKQRQWTLTKEGKLKGQRIVKLHRLWELYLTEYLRIAPDHVHEDAETIEHILTPELEARLEQLLDYPSVDPHASEIPYNH